MRISDWSSDVCSSDLIPPCNSAGIGGHQTDAQGMQLYVSAQHERCEGQYPQQCRIAPGAQFIGQSPDRLRDAMLMGELPMKIDGRNRPAEAYKAEQNCEHGTGR